MQRRRMEAVVMESCGCGEFGGGIMGSGDKWLLNK